MTATKKYDIQEKDLPEIPVYSIRKKIIEIPDELANLINTVFEEIISRGGNCSGSPILLYYKDVEFNTMEVDLEVALPVKDNALFNKVLPPVHAVSVIEHLDSNSNLEGAYTALYAWMKSNGYHPAYPIREIYSTDPQAISPEQLLVEIIIPLKREHD